MSQVDSMYQIAEQMSAKTPGPRPWVRYFARSIDRSIAFGLAAVIVGFAFIMGLRPGIEAHLLSLGITWVGWIVVEALLLSTLGTTPGKALLGVRVRTVTGENLNFFQALSRTTGVWIRGEGLGIPLVSLVTLIVAYNKLMGDRITSWDREGGTVVEHGPCGPGRVVGGLLVGVLAMFVLIFGGGLLAAVGLPAGSQYASTTTAGGHSGSVYQALAPVQPGLPSAISLRSNAAHASDASPRQTLAGTWSASSTATSGNKKFTQSTVLTLEADGTFHETLRSVDAQGVDHPEFGHDSSGTWDINGERLIEHVTTTSTRHHPVGSWVYDLSATSPDAMQLRRVSTPPTYAASSHKPLLSFQRQQASARTE